MIPTPGADEWLHRAIGGNGLPLQIPPMKGSSSWSMCLVQQGAGRKLVFRVLDNRAGRADEPDLAEHEAAALREARRAGLRGPEIIGHSSEDVGFGAPVVLMSYVEGRIDLLPGD